MVSLRSRKRGCSFTGHPDWRMTEEGTDGHVRCMQPRTRGDAGGFRSVVGEGEPDPVVLEEPDNQLGMDSDPQVDALVFLDFPPVLFRSGDASVRIIVGPALDAPDGAVRIQDGAAALALEPR
jgi:hypothetical protein